MSAQIRFELCVCDEKGHILVYCTTPELAQFVTGALNHIPLKAAEEDALGECLQILRSLVANGHEVDPHKHDGELLAITAHASALLAKTKV